MDGIGQHHDGHGAGLLEDVESHRTAWIGVAIGFATLLVVYLTYKHASSGAAGASVGMPAATGPGQINPQDTTAGQPSQNDLISQLSEMFAAENAQLGQLGMPPSSSSGSSTTPTAPPGSTNALGGALPTVDYSSIGPYANQIAGFYESILGRAPDVPGLMSWEKNAEQGWSAGKPGTTGSSSGGLSAVLAQFYDYARLHPQEIQANFASVSAGTSYLPTIGHQPGVGPRPIQVQPGGTLAPTTGTTALRTGGGGGVPQHQERVGTMTPRVGQPPFALIRLHDVPR